MPHSKPNFSRMMELIDEVFATRHDPDQIQVNQRQLKKLQAIHPATLSELADENGPVIWVLLIPTSTDIMSDFLQGAITEKQLLDSTPVPGSYECIYLCSATTLPEYRGKGKTKSLCRKAIKEICASHPIHTLFVWPFTEEGQQLAESIARECGLALKIKFPGVKKD